MEYRMLGLQTLMAILVGAIGAWWWLWLLPLKDGETMVVHEHRRHRFEVEYKFENVSRKPIFRQILRFKCGASPCFQPYSDDPIRWAKRYKGRSLSIYEESDENQILMMVTIPVAKFNEIFIRTVVNDAPVEIEALIDENDGTSARLIYYHSPEGYFLTHFRFLTGIATIIATVASLIFILTLFRKGE